MRRFLSRSRSVPISPPEWQCPENLVHPSAMPSSAPASSNSSSGPDSPLSYKGQLTKTPEDKVSSDMSVPRSTYSRSSAPGPSGTAAGLDECRCGSTATNPRDNVATLVENSIAPPRTQHPSINQGKGQRDCCFEVVNKLLHSVETEGGPASRVIVYDPHLLAVCKTVVDLDVLLGLLPQFEDYRDNLGA
ncbi:hypothetical protein BN946_scf184969.g84 [Trametes cinnabarina]|uniref:Uncharacterized protein n=1 Tax=Pycnoporus cinnabarinus TaxID=5643 RepID=A0A060ST64_PYCCI|nr:hypothetical protein BN946_scf184969.g84 [Trametes cinnabarina]